MVNLLAITIPAIVYIAVDCCKGRGHYIVTHSQDSIV